MNLLRRQINLLKGSFQGKTRNQAAFECLLDLGFSPFKARKALIALNDINLNKLARNGAGVSAPTLHNTLKGTRTNDKAMAAMANTLEIKIEVMFPDIRPQ